MTNRDIISDLNVLDDIAEMSFYEDAPDPSDAEVDVEELRTVVQDTEKHLKRVQLQKTDNFRPTTSRKSTRSPPEPNEAQLPRVPKTSSSDNSSIEKLSPNMRSRRNTTSKRRSNRENKSEDSLHSNGTNGSGHDVGSGWRVINTMDSYSYPLLFQIEKQLQQMQGQMREMEFNNGLQLRLMHRMMKALIAARHDRPVRAGLPFGLWILMFAWPVLVQFAYYWYKRNRHNLMLAFMDYM